MHLGLPPGSAAGGLSAAHATAGGAATATCIGRLAVSKWLAWRRLWLLLLLVLLLMRKLLLLLLLLLLLPRLLRWRRRLGTRLGRWRQRRNQARLQLLGGLHKGAGMIVLA